MRCSAADFAHVVAGFNVHDKATPGGHVAHDVVTGHGAATSPILNDKPLTAANGYRPAALNFYSRVLWIVGGQEFLRNHIGKQVAIANGG